MLRLVRLALFAVLAVVLIPSNAIQADDDHPHPHPHPHPHKTSNNADTPAEVDAAESLAWRNTLLVIYCLLIVAASLFGGWLPSLVNLTHTRMQTLISFVGGLMLGIGVFHLLPHAIHELGHGGVDRSVRWMLFGIVAMFLLIRSFHVHHHGPAEVDHHHDHDHDHSHGHDHDSSAGSHSHGSGLSWLGIAFGLSLHTLIDGIALGAHVTADIGHEIVLSLLGLGTFLGVLLHKPLDAVSITSLMAAGGWSKRSRHLVNLGFSLMCPLGAILFVTGVSQVEASLQHEVVGCALAFAAGVFLCISLADLLPEMEFHSHNRIRLTVALAVGIALAWGITFLEPEHLHS